MAPTPEINAVARAGFSAAASAYERGRPPYPAAALDRLAIRPGERVLDLAAGTGKLTRQLVDLGASVVAVEPLAEMRAHLVGIESLEGTAEAIPLADDSVDVVTVGQAFHWFDRDAALAEIGRVLRPGGRLGLLWNERDLSVPWVAELDRLSKEGAVLAYDKEVDWLAVLGAWGVEAGSVEVGWDHEVDEDGLVAQVLSRSYVAVQPAARQAEIEAAIRSMVAGFPAIIRIPHVTTAYWCRTSS